ncbi:Negative regulator of mitotic exit, partial [Ascosphaera aggregata]
MQEETGEFDEEREEPPAQQQLKQGSSLPQQSRSASAASNGRSPTPGHSRSPVPVGEDRDDTDSQNGSVNNGLNRPLPSKASSLLGSVSGGSRTASPADSTQQQLQQQQQQPTMRARGMPISPAQPAPVTSAPDTVAPAKQNTVPEIEVAAPNVPTSNDPTHTAVAVDASVGASAGALAGAAAEAEAETEAAAPRNGHQQNQDYRRTPSNATSMSNYTVTSAVSAATVITHHGAAGQRDSTQNSHGGSLQRSNSTASVTKVAARAMEAGEAAPLVRTPSGHRRRLGSVGSVGSRSRDSTYSVGAPGPATHDGAEIEDSLLSVTLPAPASSSSSPSSHSPLPPTSEPKRNSKRISYSDWDAPKSPRLTPHQEALMKELDAVKRKNAWFAGELALARKAGYVPSTITPPVRVGPAAFAADKFRNTSHGSSSSFGSSFGGTTSNADSETIVGGSAGTGPTSAALSKHASVHGLYALEQDTSTLKDEDKPLLEALLAMRAELITMQSTVEQQAATAARKVAEIEQQRDVAVREAVYAQAKLAALGGSIAVNDTGVSRSGTAMSDNSPSATPTNTISAKEKELKEKDLDTLHAERAIDMSRRLALALVAQNEMKQRVDALTAESKEEQHARQIAEELREATSQRLGELEAKNRDLVELESLRAEVTALHDALNEEQTARAHAESQMKIAEIDKRELEDKLEEAEVLASGSADNFAVLREAVSASEERASHIAKQLTEANEREEMLGQQLREAKTAVEEKTLYCQELERQVAESKDMVQLLQRRSEEDRVTREEIDKHLLEVTSDRDTIVAELEETRRRLKDASEIAEKHAREAETHRAAFLSGFDRVASSRSLRSPLGGSDNGSEHNPISDERVSALREQVDRANERARTHQEAAEAATEKLRRAEERIAGLEAYQEQSAREGLQLRRQLQVATREARLLALEVRDVKAQLESQQRDASALSVQHNALKELLNERNLHYSDSTRRSPRLESPASNSNPSRFGTPEQSRLREVEQQLQASMKAHEETKAMFEQREQEAEKTYNERIQQLGKDYRSAVHYVKSTEKMLHRMKDELEKYKTQNAKFQSELENVNRQSSSPEYSARAAAEWESERSHLQGALADAQEKMNTAVVELESQVSKLHEDVAAARAERDKARRAEEALEQEVYELSEKNRTEIARMRSENAALESRASDAERRVMVLLESSITAQQAQSGAVRRSQSNASSDTIGRILSRSRGNSVSTLSRDLEPDTENVPLRSHSAAGATSTSVAGALRPAVHGHGDQPVDQRTSLALDSLTSELDALRSHWEASNRRNYRLSSNTIEPDREDLTRVHEEFEVGGEDGKEEPFILSESLVGWRKKLEEEEQKASIGDMDN